MSKVLTDPQNYKDIADAIRSKNGTSATYKPSEMADAVRAISGGGGGGNVDLSGVSFRGSTFTEIPQWIYDASDTITGINDLFRDCANLVSTDDWDVSNATSLFDMYYNDKNLKTVGNINAPKCDNFNSMFRSCSELTTIGVISMTGLTFNLFGANVQNMFTSCSKLTNSSLKNIVKSLLTTDYTSMPSKSTFAPVTLKQMGLTSAQAEICASFEEWKTLSDAGWKTGY